VGAAGNQDDEEDHEPIGPALKHEDRLLVRRGRELRALPAELVPLALRFVGCQDDGKGATAEATRCGGGRAAALVAHPSCAGL